MNISHSDTGGDFTSDLHGDGIDQGIFGFCTINNFDRIVTVLQEDSLIFVNQVADIVHSNIALHYGICNKNLGDTFLLLWKIPELNVNFDGDLDSVIINDSHICDMAIYGCLKAIAKLHSYEHMRKYRKIENLTNTFGPNFTPEISFGIHMGTAYEGAVGSQWKIDATQVSPDVTVSARLNLATDYYKVPILISQ